MTPLREGMCHIGYLIEEGCSVSSKRVNQPHVILSLSVLYDGTNWLNLHLELDNNGSLHAAESKFMFFSHHQNGCLAGWEQLSPRDPSEERPAETSTLCM